MLKFTDRRLEKLLYQEDCAISPVHQLLLTGLSFVQLVTPIGSFTIYQLQDPDTPAHYVRPMHPTLPTEYVEAVEQQMLESNLLVAELCRPTIHVTKPR